MIRNFLFGAIPVASLPAALALLLLRVVPGLAFATHGLAKYPVTDGFVDLVAGLGFPAPLFFAWAALISELVGGVCVALGLLTRPMAILALFTMATAAFGQHGADPFAKKELAVLYFCIMTTFAIFGGSAFAVDRLFRKA